ncbi:MAG: c-type cytochrome biogenesis protein CcmI [Alphaproteobacteria bacterium]|nr:MAG: c-type cytochrome biogenesis protein CcmI [Alphaproteobacteria bacterium]
MIWIVLALMTAAALGFALYPLVRGGRPDAGASRLAVFERQLEEIAADEAAGALGPEEARAARLEIERRILAADREGQGDLPVETARGRHTLVAAAGVILVAGMLLYLSLGSPQMEGHPYRAPGIDQVEDDGPDMNALVDRLIAHLDENPGDLQGWQHFRRAAPLLDRQHDLAAALARATRARPDNPALAMLYAESLMLLAGGRITPAASLALDRVEELAPGNPALRYYRALALMQQGEVAKARAAWAALLQDTPADAPWREDIVRRIAQADRQLGRDTGPDGAGAAIASLPPEQRQAAIRSMVEGLAARLADEPENLDGWVRLARSWQVLGEAAKAREAWLRVRDLAERTGRSQLVAEADAALNRR